MKNWLPAALLSVVLLLVGCSGSPAQEPETATFFAMDTAMDFTVYGDAALLDEAETLIGSLEEQVSVTDEHSDIYAIDHTGSGSLSGNAAELMAQALELCRTASRRVEAHLKYIGWDVAITPDGPVLVEGNNLPGYDMCQNAGHVDEGMLPRFEKLLGRPIM